jgi:hypothetical protein
MALSIVDAPSLGRSISEWVYTPGAIYAGMYAGFDSFVRTYDVNGANQSFSSVYNQEMSKKDSLGGRIINWTIETTNSPHGFDSLPWYGKPLRAYIDGELIFAPGKKANKRIKCMVSIKIRALDRAAYARRIVLTQFIIYLRI